MFWDDLNDSNDEWWTSVSGSPTEKFKASILLFIYNGFETASFYERMNEKGFVALLRAFYLVDEEICRHVKCSIRTKFDEMNKNNSFVKGKWLQR